MKRMREQKNISSKLASLVVVPHSMTDNNKRGVKLSDIEVWVLNHLSHTTDTTDTKHFHFSQRETFIQLFT